MVCEGNTDISVTPWKLKVAASFGAAAETYESCAEIQDQVAGILAGRIKALSIPNAPCLEIGCGTGLLSKKVAGPGWTVTDLSPSMLAQCSKNLGNPEGLTFLPMDGERPTVNGPFALICANLAVQWFDDLRGTLDRLAGLLVPGGHLVLSTFGAGTFEEWTQAHEQQGLLSSTPDFASFAGLSKVFPSGGELDLREDSLALTFPSGFDFVKNLKGLGAQTPPKNTQPLSAGEMRRILSTFDQAGPPVVTHNILHAVWTRD